MPNSLIYFILAYCVLREVFFSYQMNKLMNKLMSRNYHDYQFSNHVEKTMTQEQTVQSALKEDQALQEDLGIINNFG